MANKVGRPADYKSAQELEDKVDQYFENGFRTKKVTNSF